MTSSSGTGDPRSSLRTALRDARRRLDPQEVALRSGALTAIVLDAEVWRSARSIAAFVGVGGEPDTRALLDEAWAMGKQVWLPRVQGEDLAFVQVRDARRLVAGRFGLIEPVSDGEAERTLVEVEPALVVIPGLAFGRDGARIGFGRGFYDRALAPLRGRIDVRRLGLCFSSFLYDARGPIPMAAHDVPMHAVATDEEFVACEAGPEAD